MLMSCSELMHVDDYDVYVVYIYFLLPLWWPQMSILVQLTNGCWTTTESEPCPESPPKNASCQMTTDQFADPQCMEKMGQKVSSCSMTGDSVSDPSWCACPIESRCREQKGSQMTNQFPNQSASSNRNRQFTSITHIWYNIVPRSQDMQRKRRMRRRRRLKQ